MAQRMTGGDAIVQSLLLHGVDTVFAIPGVQTYALFDAFHAARDRIRVIGPRHEQTTAYMAFGYAKSTGKVGVYSVVPGPGVLNAGAAMCSAYGASTPLLCITGQVPADFIGSGKGHLHELPDQLATLRTLTKWSARIEHPSDAPGLVAQAFHELYTGRPRPVSLEMPWNTYNQRAPVELVGPPAAYPTTPIDTDLVDQAAALLKDARNPMIMVGSGAMHASAEVRALAELIQAPVVSFRSGRGIVGNDHPLGFNCAEGFERWHGTDVLIAIGTRMELEWFRWPDHPPALKTIQIDIDPTQAARFKPTLAIVGDSKRATAELVSSAERAGARRASRIDEYRRVKADVATQVEQIQPHVAYLRAIREALPRDGLFVEEICQAGFTSYYGFPVYEPWTFISCGHQGTLGFGFPTALGVKVAHPDKPVVAIAGDGGFMFGVQDLATAVQYGINVVTVLFNNSAYGNVLRDQRRVYGGRVIGAELRNPDFLKLADSFGVAAARVTDPAALKREVAKAIDRDAPALIEVVVDPSTEVSPWQFLMPAPRVSGKPIYG